ncbi:hypothetical protein LINGRAHAP2_LOCUS26912, partial [Linum grandiflorum]
KDFQTPSISFQQKVTKGSSKAQTSNRDFQKKYTKSQTVFHRWLQNPNPSNLQSQTTNHSSLSGNKVGSKSPCIVVDRIGDMVSQVLQRTLSGDNRLNEETKHREHSQPPVLDLLHLQLSKRLRVVGQTQRVKAPTRVKRVNNFPKWTSSNTVPFHSAHENHLAGPDGQDALSVDQARVAQVVKPTFAEDLGSGLEPNGLSEFNSVPGEQLREDAA